MAMRADVSPVFASSVGVVASSLRRPAKVPGCGEASPSLLVGESGKAEACVGPANARANSAGRDEGSGGGERSLASRAPHPACGHLRSQGERKKRRRSEARKHRSAARPCSEVKRHVETGATSAARLCSR